MRAKSLNLTKFIQLGILAAFLLSWSSAANGAILCQCKDGHLSVENFYTGPCEHDAEHKHNEKDHSDVSCDCDDAPYSSNLSTDLTKVDSDFNFVQITPITASSAIGKSSFLEQNYVSYVLNDRRIVKDDIHYLKTIILII